MAANVHCENYPVIAFVNRNHRYFLGASIAKRQHLRFREMLQPVIQFSYEQHETNNQLQTMQIEKIDLHTIALPLVHPFRTSTGSETERTCILVAVHSGGITGWGECVAMRTPDYSAETVITAHTMLTRHIIPRLLHSPISHPSDVTTLLRPVRGNPMAKAGIECALWDWFAQQQGVPLSALIGGVRPRVPVGVSIGIQPTIEQLLARVGRFVDQGYQRVKLKIKPGWDMGPLAAVRHAFPHIALMVDANSAYTHADSRHLKQLDAFDLLMVEQPFAYNDFVDHAHLQKQISTPVCLDESIDSPAAMSTAIALGACQVVNVKVGRVGGITNLLAIHQQCEQNGIALWCGGMLETGIGRATNIHLAALPAFTLPGDISATDRYFRPDIATPPFILNPDSTMSVPTTPGIGVTLDHARLAAVQIDHQAFAN